MQKCKCATKLSSRIFQLSKPRYITPKFEPSTPPEYKCTVSEKISDRLKELSQPRYLTPKYIAECEYFAFSPQLNIRKPALRELSRPLRVPKVPLRFQNLELEIDWWSNLRFKVRKSALKYEAGDNILCLAEPKTIPQPEPKIECIPERKRMKPKQWKEHLTRLKYLSKPRNPNCHNELTPSKESIRKRQLTENICTCS